MCNGRPVSPANTPHEIGLSVDGGSLVSSVSEDVVVRLSSLGVQRVVKFNAKSD